MAFKRRRKTKASKAKLAKNTELASEYGLTLTYWRYSGRKGIYWALTSEFVRKRDFYKYGTCISCEKEFGQWKDSQAGHYAPAGNCGFALLFDQKNVHGECAKCNNPVFSPGKLIQYRQGLVKRYGEAWVKKLDARYTFKDIKKEWTQGEYNKEIKKLQRKIKALDKRNDK